MLNEMSSCELEYWRIRNSTEFLGAERADFNAARIQATIINWSGGLEEGAAAKSAIDLMPYLERPKTEEEASEEANTLLFYERAKAEGIRRNLAEKQKQEDKA